MPDSTILSAITVWGRMFAGCDDVTAPDGINVPRWVCNDPQRRAVMSEIITVGLDLAKNVF
ncbi:hypothetical protein OEZ60_19935, partial [Defluviimonas sp. WL0024]